MKGFYRFIRGVAYIPFKIIYPTKVIGIERLPANPIVSVSNHLRWLDIPLLWVNVKGFRHFIAKKEIGKNPLVRCLATNLGVIFVDRGKADMKFIRTAVGLLKDGEGLSLFPEGTRNRHGETLQEIKSGAALLSLKGNAPIVPIMFYRRAKAFRKNYIYVGEPFELDDFKGRLLDTVALERASEEVAAHMSKAVEELSEYVTNKLWKRDKKLKKERKKIDRRYKKESVRAAVNLKKSLARGEFF